MPPKIGGTFLKNKLLALLCALALLVSNTAACFASRLTRSLALAATAALSGLTKIFGIKSFDCHDKYLRKNFSDNILTPICK